MIVKYALLGYLYIDWHVNLRVLYIVYLMFINKLELTERLRNVIHKSLLKSLKKEITKNGKISLTIALKVFNGF